MRIFLALGLCLLLGLVPQARAAVIINEFLAENDGGLADENGDTPDWIELLNSSLAPVSLAGWHLTDTPTNLTKWAFPATSIASGGYLVVFASGKDRATNGAPLHANFSLQNDGGYLALVSNGVVVSSFNYPAQHRNVSYGPGTTNAPTTTLLAASASARWLLPASGALGATWTGLGFNDSAWSNASSPLGFTAGAAPGAPVLSLDFNDDDSGEAGAANTETGFSTMTLGANPGVFGGITVTLSALSGGVLDDRDRAVPVQAGLLTLDQIYDDFIFINGQTNGNGARIQITGLTPNTNFQLTVWSYDNSSTGARVSDWVETASGATRVITNGFTFDGAVVPALDTDHTFGGALTSSITGALTIEGRRNGGTSHGVFLNGLRLAPFTGFTVSGSLAPMHGSNSSVYARWPFNVAGLDGAASLTLRVRYNDGFVAYLNGTEVARRNAPASPAWNSAATNAHSAALAEDIVLPGALGLLNIGANVLAVHGLNLSTTNADFSLEPQLFATLLAATNGYFSPVTPNAANGPALYGVVADTKFSVNRGFFDAPFSLSITTATAGASIYYTTNGAAPTPASGLLHTAPISITGNSFIRAQAFVAGWVPGGVDTHSYIFLTDVLRQSNNIPGYPTTWQASYPADYAMDSNIVNHVTYGATISNDLRSIPSLMLVTEQNGLWHSSTGIYPNATSTGAAWERAASAELIARDGGTEFATTMRIEMHGNASRDNVRTPKHSIRLNFNSDYGPTKLDYNWFGGGVRSHDAIILRSAGFVDGWAGRYADNGLYISSETGEQFRGLRYRPETTLYLRDEWVKESFRDMGWFTSRSAATHLYLNGLYWGLYFPSERYGAHYFSEHLGGDEGAWDVLVGEDNNGPTVVVDGSVTDWNAVLALVAAPVASEPTYAAITNAVDMDNLIDYMLLHIVAESEDWPRHNWYAAHRRATNGVPGTKFVFAVWDQELTLDRLVRRNRIDAGNNAGGAGEQYSPARIYFQCRNWPEFRLRFADRVHKHLFNDGALTPAANAARLLAASAGISNALVGESARWGDARTLPTPGNTVGTSNTFTRNEWWQPELDKTLTNFFQKLTADNVARFQVGNLYPLVGAPVFSQFGGAVSNGFALTLTHTNAAGTIYFTTDESDPRTYGSGAVAGGAQAYATPIPVNAPTVVRARVLNAGVWSALAEAVFFPPQDFSKLALTELMYNPPQLGMIDGDEFEFLELKNTGTNTLNLSGLNFSGIGFTFTNGTLLAPGEFFVLVRNTATFNFKYPSAPAHGLYTGALNNAGEPITLRHALGATIFAVSYGDRAPWPVTPDGFGFSLVPVQPGITQAPDDGAKWRASSAAGGSPGADDPATAVAPVVINEALTHTDLPSVDRIELFNPTAFPVDIGGWFLTDDAAVPKKFRIPNGTTIFAFNFVSFDESQFNATPGTNGSFSLGSSGEQIYLFSGNADTNLTGWSHGFAFGAAANGVTFGRYVNSVGEEQFPAQISTTFLATNSGPRVGPLVINEIHYNPVVPGDAFVELKNISAASVPLYDLARPTNTWKLDGVGFTFRTNFILPPGGFALIVASNVNGFMANYAVPPGVPVFSYESLGSLQNSGERLSLTRPDAPDTNGTPHIVVDSVRYNDKLPWPPAADGSGPSLQKKFSNQYGDDPINWQAATATPGRENASPDSDGDGLPDDWEQANGTLVNTPDAADDYDGDGFTNWQEYLAGTHPNSAQSRLRVESIEAGLSGVVFQFTAASNRTFTVQAKDALDAPSWSPLTNITAAPQTRVIQITVPPTNSAKFFRIAAP